MFPVVAWNHGPELLKCLSFGFGGGLEADRPTWRGIGKGRVDPLLEFVNE
jgi:hypothetical protein